MDTKIFITDLVYKWLNTEKNNWEGKKLFFFHIVWGNHLVHSSLSNHTLFLKRLSAAEGKAFPNWFTVDSPLKTQVINSYHMAER